MPLGRTELEFLSLFYYIKEGILSRDFHQEAINQPLVYDPTLFNGVQRLDYVITDPDNSEFKKLPITEGRGWLSFDITSRNYCEIYNTTTSSYVSTYNTPFQNSYSIPTERESTYIKVYDTLGNEMDRSWYELDYANGRVRYPCPDTPSGVVASGILPSTIDFMFHSVATLEGWPDSSNIPALPFVAIYPTTEQPSGFQIGAGVEFTRGYVIDIFAKNLSDKREITNAISSGLFNKHCPVIDFNRTGHPLKEHGVINPNFIQNINYSNNIYRSYLTLNPGNGNILYFLSIEVLYDASPRETVSESMQHMAKIKFKTRTYTDRDPDLVGKFAGLQEPIGGFDSLIQKAYTT